MEKQNRSLHLLQIAFLIIGIWSVYLIVRGIVNPFEHHREALSAVSGFFLSIFFIFKLGSTKNDENKKESEKANGY